MQVLICDDDTSTRFVVRRLLEENFGCVVTEAADGVDALKLMAKQKFAFILLDIEMPCMDGIDTLEEIRSAPATKDTPVIILSRERNEDNVLRLMRLGITDYLLKPLRNPVALAKVEKLVKMLPRTTVNASTLEGIRLSADTPAMIVDGNLDYRFFFATQLEPYGRIVQADSGAAALSLSRRTPLRLVFVGGDLGIVSAERLVSKLREANPDGIRIIHLFDNAPRPSDAKLFDATVRRSFVPEAFRSLIRPYVVIPGPLMALQTDVPELPAIVSSAASQVFGMMFDSEIVPSAAESALSIGFSSTLQIQLDDRYTLDLGVHLTKEAALAAAGKMTGLPPADLQDEDLLSVAGELGNMVTGRVHARFAERGMKSVCSLPKLLSGDVTPRPSVATGLVQRFVMPTVSDFLLSLNVEDRLSSMAMAALKGDAVVTEGSAA